MTVAPTIRSTHWRAVPCLALMLALAPVAVLGQERPAATISSDPVDALSMHLRTLAIAPRSLSALLGAGEAAIAVGDSNAALGFFARAEQVDGRSGRAKAGLGTALVMLERPNDALMLFGQAVSLGVPEADIARDRGLAYDLRGDSRRAQRDYVLALKRGPDDEATRRHALSLGISGDRAQALAMLDPLLRKKDQSAWRARAFILAMNGDVTGANGIARQVMPAPLAQTMAPFLARLPQLNAADRAHAVNFGTIPSNGASMASVEIGDPFRPVGGAAVGGNAGDGLIPAGEPLGTRRSEAQAARVAEPLSREPRRRPGREPVVAVVKPESLPGFTTMPTTKLAEPVDRRLGARVGTRIATIDRAALPPEARGEGTASLVVGRTELPPPSAVRVSPVLTAPVVTPPPAPATPIAAPVYETPPAATRALIGPPAVAAETLAAPVPVPAPIVVKPRISRLEAILAGIEPEQESVPVALPTASEIRAAKRLAQRKATETAAAAAADKAAKDAKAAELEAARRNPARLWVQVATGNNTRGLPSTWARIRDGNATALKGKTAYSVPYKATNRLLVGPMKSPADARALVNALAKGGVSATTYSSEAGQEVDRIAAK